MTRHISPRRRLGFTLIELLVVIIVIGILVGLLIPAVASAMRKAREAAVQAEISNLASALADFKNKRGDYPPSRIAVREDGGYFPADTTSLATTNGSTNDVLLGTLYIRGANAIRKFWPRVTLVNGGSVTGSSLTLGSTSTSGSWYDYNGDGAFGVLGNTTTGVYILQGNQCLVFFLGGIPQKITDSNSGNVTVGVTGFGRNPLNPFSNNNPGNAMYNANREASLYEFAPGRLGIDPNGMGLYVDSMNSSNAQANAYFSYFSNNNGSGYDPNDINDIGPGETDSLASAQPLTLYFLVPQSTTATTSSPSPNPYTTGMPSGTGTSTVTYINANSFQLFASGSDGVFGVGGYYNANSAGAALALPPENAISNSTDTSLRTLEWDNLTNFHNGRLQ